MFNKYRGEGKPLLLISGPDEFLADAPFGTPYGLPEPSHGGLAVKKGSGPLPPPQEARLALAAHNLLRVNAGWLSPKAAAWMRGAAKAVPSGYSEVGTDPVSLVLPTAAGKIGLVLFPRGDGPKDAPTPEQQKRVLAAAAALRPSAALIIGVSPWGFEAERDFLPLAQGVFSCLLGGGDGPGFAKSLQSQSPGVLWARSDSKGRSVTEITLLQRPGDGFRWTEGTSFNARLIDLKPNVAPPDRTMEALIQSR